jgi:hypothetical protein
MKAGRKCPREVGQKHELVVAAMDAACYTAQPRAALEGRKPVVRVEWIFDLGV